MGAGRIFFAILLFPFKVILFPFRMIRRTFASRETRHFWHTRDGLREEVAKGERALENKNLSEGDKKAIRDRVSKVKDSINLLETNFKKQKRLKDDPDNQARFMAQKRAEWELRKKMGELKK